MIKRIISALVAGTSLASAAHMENSHSLGGINFILPAGWSQTEASDERIAFRSPDGRQQATISLMEFKTKPSFDDFKKLCDLRLQAERKGIDGVFIEPETPEPVSENGKYLLIYSGGEKKSGRIFSAFLRTSGAELLTVYVEGIGVDAKTNLETFRSLVSSLQQK